MVLFKIQGLIPLLLFKILPEIFDGKKRDKYNEHYDKTSNNDRFGIYSRKNMNKYSHQFHQ